MTIGLCGAHGTGKTTLAKAVVARATGMAMVASRASELFKAAGLPMDRPLTFDERIAIQGDILQAHYIDAMEAGTFAISDRTPIDMATYMLGEWGANCTGEQGKRLMKYVENCFTTTNRLYSSIVLVQPGIPYVADAKRPPPNDAAVEMFNYLASALLRDRRLSPPIYVMARTTTDLKERAALVCNVWNQVCTKAEEALHGIDAN